MAEDVSGMPTLCRAVSEGGVGFDARLGMGTPDLWVRVGPCSLRVICLSDALRCVRTPQSCGLLLLTTSDHVLTGL